MFNHVTLISCSLFCAVFFQTVSGQIVISKDAKHENPQLYVSGFTGSAEVEKKVRETLLRCGWFDVINQAAPTGYVLDGAEAGGQLSLRVQKGGAVVATVQVRVPGDDVNELVYTGVDAVIETLFKTPGPCLSRIAFATENNGKKEVVTCYFDGSGMERLTYNQSISTEPAWGRTTDFLVYTLYGSGGGTRVMQVDMKQGRQRVIAAFPGLNSGAALSPDGAFAALCLSRDQQVDLYVMRIADGKLRRLTRDRSVESSPTWSPDGKHLCYVSDRAGGRPQLYVMPAAGGRAERVFADYAEAVSPDWSPVSNKICFATRMGGQYVIGVLDMAADTREKTIISSGPGDFEAPSWGGDGRHLVCTRTVPGGRQIMMLDTWTPRSIAVTKPGGNSLPSWAPVR
ncbi:MAG: hypothetical protein RRC34_02045 [Lentisphaeria bacterium]|nr:hypothetical protein [Lentisphaeria bacterium]